MSKSWQFLIIIALGILGLYTGFELFNSITGTSREFNATIEGIDNSIGEDVLTHIQNTENRLYYKNSDNNNDK